MIQGSECAMEMMHKTRVNSHQQQIHSIGVRNGMERTIPTKCTRLLSQYRQHPHYQHHHRINFHSYLLFLSASSSHHTIKNTMEVEEAMKRESFGFIFVLMPILSKPSPQCYCFDYPQNTIVSVAVPLGFEFQIIVHPFVA